MVPLPLASSMAISLGHTEVSAETGGLSVFGTKFTVIFPVAVHPPWSVTFSVYVPAVVTGIVTAVELAGCQLKLDKPVVSAVRKMVSPTHSVSAVGVMSAETFVMVTTMLTVVGIPQEVMIAE